MGVVAKLGNPDLSLIVNPSTYVILNKWWLFFPNLSFFIQSLLLLFLLTELEGTQREPEPTKGIDVGSVFLHPACGYEFL